MKMAATKPRTLFDKVWDAHVVEQLPDGTCVLYIDRHLVHEVTSPQAFEGLRMAGRKVRRPDATIAVADHNTPTTDGAMDEESRVQVETLEKNVADFGVPYFDMGDPRRGIVHVIGPEQGATLPGMTEDVTEFIMNLKDVVVKNETEEPVVIRLDVKGPKAVLAGDLPVPAGVEILNPDLHLAQLNSSGHLALDITI